VGLGRGSSWGKKIESRNCGGEDGEKRCQIGNSELKDYLGICSDAELIYITALVGQCPRRTGIES